MDARKNNILKENCVIFTNISHHYKCIILLEFHVKMVSSSSYPNFDSFMLWNLRLNHHKVFTVPDMCTVCLEATMLG